MSQKSCMRPTGGVGFAGRAGWAAGSWGELWEEALRGWGAVKGPAIDLPVQALALHTVVCPSLAGSISQTGNFLVRAGGSSLALWAASGVNSWLGADARHRGTIHTARVARADVATVSPFRPIQVLLSLEQAGGGAEMRGV